HSVVETPFLGVQGPRNLLGSHRRRVCPLPALVSPVGLGFFSVAALLHCLVCAAPRLLRARHPQVLSVSDNFAPIVKPDSIARPVVKHIESVSDLASFSGLIENFVTDLETAHRCPAGGRRNWRIESQRLARVWNSRNNRELA